MRRRVEQQHPARRGRPPAQARAGRTARHRVRRAAAAARARPHRPAAAQLHHADRARGADHPRLRRPPTTRRQLDAAYRFLRTLEHRIQLHRLRRTHLLPEDEHDLRRLGRSMGYRSDPVTELTAAWRGHAHEVRRLHEKLFYRPLLAAVARLEDGEARLTPEAARERLEGAGLPRSRRRAAPPGGAASGVSRRAAIQRTLLPVMLGWFADAADPDGGPARLSPGQRRARFHPLVPAGAA